MLIYLQFQHLETDNMKIYYVGKIGRFAILYIVIITPEVESISSELAFTAYSNIK